MRRIFFSLLVFALTLPALAQAKHPFTFEDMMKLKRVGDPQVSPDGKWVIFSVVDVDLAANTKTPHIWIVPLTSGHVGTAAPGRPAEQSSAGSSSAERILIADQDGDRPRWAPDGKRFAFLSTKEGGSQVWVAEFDSAAGHSRCSAKGYVLSHRGGWRTLVSGWQAHTLHLEMCIPNATVHPSRKRTATNKKSRRPSNRKSRRMIFDRLLYRHWNAYKEGKRSHLFVIRVRGPQARKGL